MAFMFCPLTVEEVELRHQRLLATVDVVAERYQLSTLGCRASIIGRLFSRACRGDWGFRNDSFPLQVKENNPPRTQTWLPIGEIYERRH